MPVRLLLELLRSVLRRQRVYLSVPRYHQRDWRMTRLGKWVQESLAFAGRMPIGPSPSVTVSGLRAIDVADAVLEAARDIRDAVPICERDTWNEPPCGDCSWCRFRLALGVADGNPLLGTFTATAPEVNR